MKDAEENNFVANQEEGQQVQKSQIIMGKIGSKKKKGKNDKKEQEAEKVQNVKHAMGGFIKGEALIDMEPLRRAVQTLVQNTNPLGKCMDMLQEGGDSMSKEYEMWKKQGETHAEKLRAQQKITEDQLVPIQDRVAEIEEKIRVQQAKINNVKSVIIRNDITIQTLLGSVLGN